MGIDLQLASGFDTSYGFFDARLFWSHQLEYKQNAYFRGGLQDTAGFNLQPQNRAQASAGWSKENHAVDLVINFIGEHSEMDEVDEDSGSLTTSSAKLDTWTTANMSYRYDAGQWGQLKIGANNITNEDPVMDFEGKYARDHYDLYDSLGRVWYAEYKISFE
jgi:iron complex outermembrane receptor protein